MLFLTYLSEFLVTREKLQKIVQHISHSQICILLTLLIFLALPIKKQNKIKQNKTKQNKKRIYKVWFLFSMSPGVDSYSRHFETINN